jgi:hypothetical protein
MAQITLTFNTTAAQDVKLAKILAQVNAQRAGLSQAPFATVDLWLRDEVISLVMSRLFTQEELEGATRKQAYAAATAGIKAQIDVLLGIT